MKTSKNIKRITSMSDVFVIEDKYEVRLSYNHGYILTIKEREDGEWNEYVRIDEGLNKRKLKIVNANFDEFI